MKEEIAKMRLQIAQLIAGQPIKAVALDLTTVDGTPVVVVTEAEAPKVGDAVTDAEGNPVADGEHTFEKIKVVTVGGIITEITEVEEVAAVDAEALAKELAELKAEREQEKTAFAELQKEFAQVAKLQSTYKPAAQQVAFRKTAADQSPKEVAGYNAIKEARAARKTAQATK